MSAAYAALKLAHILGATVLFGTGLGIAFFMVMAWRSRDLAGFALAARHVVIADVVFTAVAVVAQPITGLMLARVGGWPLDAPWLLWSYGLYIFTGACWLPVVWIQARVAKRLRAAVAAGADATPDDVDRLMRIWFALGWPAFFAVVAILALMIAKPA